MEHNPILALSPSLPRFGCFWVFMFDVFQSKRRGGVGRNQDLSSHLFCLPSVNTGAFGPVSQREQESRQTSQNISLWSLGYLQRSWFLERAQRQFHLLEETLPWLHHAPHEGTAPLSHVYSRSATYSTLPLASPDSEVAASSQPSS